MITSAVENAAIEKFATTKEHCADIFTSPFLGLNFKAYQHHILRDEINQIGNQRKNMVQSLIA
jgi:hypothetical protein